MAVLKRRFNESELSARHHLDVLHELSPEITSLIYADNQGLLNSEMRPLLAVFRKLESDEKIALIESTTQMYGYDAQIEINRESETGMTRRVELQEGGKTTRELNRGRTLIELQKMKYNFGRAVVKDHLEGQKYLSDNELRATIFEAEAKVESIKLVEQLRSGTLRQLSRDRLEERIRESELKHASLIKQAEETRILGQDTNRKEIAIAYIEEQAKINRELINYEMEEERANSIIHSAYYDALKEISLGGIDILKASDKKMFEFNVNGTYGEINLNIGVKE